MARAGGAALDFGEMIDWAKARGGSALREMGFHERARMLKALATYLDGRKEELYALNPLTGATRKDGWIDIDGGIGTMFVFASKGCRCGALRCMSTPSTFPYGECWKSSHPRFLPVCRRS